MKEEKLAQIHRLAQGAGLSASDVSEYLPSRYKKEILEGIYQLVRREDIPFSEVSDYLSRKEEDELLSQPEIYPGMFVYEDNTFSQSLIPERQVKAVVGYVEGRTVYAVCLGEKNLPWSSTDLRVVETRCGTTGQEATRAILEAAEKTGGRAEAAQWCNDYAEDGVKQGEAFLPSKAELTFLARNKDAVNTSLKLLGASLLECYVWTSSEVDDSRAYLKLIQLDCDNTCPKNIGYRVKPILAIRV